MKLSNDIIAIERAFDELISSIEHLDHPSHNSNHGRRIRSDLPRDRLLSDIPIIPTQYTPLTTSNTHNNKLLLLKLAAFEATYHDSLTPHQSGHGPSRH